MSRIDEIFEKYNISPISDEMVIKTKELKSIKQEILEAIKEELPNNDISCSEKQFKIEKVLIKRGGK